MTGKAGKRAKGNGGAPPRAEYVQEAIREAIHEGRYGPGERIRETELASWLEVSRTPVREALRRLEAEGLLTFVPWRGVVVAELDRQQVIELYAMREVLEGAAAGLAARHVGEAEIDVLDGLLARAAKADGEPEKLAAVNRNLHQAIYAAGHNRYLLQTLNSLRNSLALLRGTTFALEGRSREAQKEHAAIVAAIKKGDAEAAEQAARAHIRAATRARFRMLFELEDEA
jgi:DNA-binding GntR family transcriptional regulator